MDEFHDNANKYVKEIVLKVRDLKKSYYFYKNIMGFEVLKEENNKVLLTVDGSTPIVTLIHFDDTVKKIPKRTGLYHYALLLPSRYYLGLFIKNLQEMNYPIAGASDHGVSEAVYLKDPDDNGIEVYSDFKSSEWNRENGKIEMITRPLDYESLLDMTDDNKWKGMPSKTIIGHIHLHVDDLLKAKEFYVQGLGLNVVQQVGDSVLFLSTGGYHHHIAINTWNGVGIDPLPENSAGMKYFSIHFPNEKSRIKSIKRLKNLGYKIIKEKDNIYIKDPAQNLLKLVIH
ncbi:MAG: VOC family protein [Bacillota bacterium]